MKVIKPWSKKFEKLFQRSVRRDRRVEEKVRRIIDDVKNDGDEAVLRYTRKFDRVKLTAKELRVTESEINGAYQNISPDFVSALKLAVENVSRFYRKQTKRSWKMVTEDGVILGERVKPLESVGIYIPAGTVPLPSTVYMTVLPAKLAGVEKIYLMTPPNKHKSVDPHILAVANLLKVDGIFKAGGAQGIAAMALGTKTIPRVDKIIGPGNAYVAEAKRQVFGYCDIDMIAGPSELVILANDYSDPDFVAADLMAQSEHHMGTAILVTTSKRLAKIIKKVPGKGHIILVKNLKQGVDVINQIAPEHLQIMVKSPQRILKDVKHAGAIFIGAYTPTAVGDYVAGPSHVLPTNGTARFFSGLGVYDFLKSSHVISYNRKALEKIKPAIEHIGGLEGLTKHVESVKIRFYKHK
ncbi:MAG: histidinol dehydrogenase [Omnitrophica bacterium RIFCSPHIGHO2_02_FULL_51_18]|nr:MAG: histidinol dehydrogenase [Omnitrophica bacterium RIFCSPHIGHO2_02_FULL_51_18]